MTADWPYFHYLPQIAAQSGYSIMGRRMSYDMHWPIALNKSLHNEPWTAVQTQFLDRLASKFLKVCTNHFYPKITLTSFSG